MRALALPDDPAGLAGWLESEIVGLHLRRLAAELATVHRGSPVPSGSLDDWLGGQKSGVLAHGLAAIPANRLTDLLRRPDWLLELQQLVLADGGAYWDAVPRPQELDDRARRTWKVLREQFSPPVEASSVRKSVWLRVVLPFAAASLATAAALFVAINGGLFERPGREVAGARPQAAPDAKVKLDENPPPMKAMAGAKSEPAAKMSAGIDKPSGAGPGAPPPPAPLKMSRGNPKENESKWGFANLATAKSKPDRAEYLKLLADAAKEWSRQKPEDRASVARRVREFRDGCKALQQAEHAALTPEDQVWLKENCQKWADSLDGHLKSLDNGTSPTSVRNDVDQLVKTIVADLEKRSAAPPK